LSKVVGHEILGDLSEESRARLISELGPSSMIMLPVLGLTMSPPIFKSVVFARPHGPG
jgi:hypothetical protein